MLVMAKFVLSGLLSSVILAMRLLASKCVQENVRVKRES